MRSFVGHIFDLHKSRNIKSKININKLYKIDFYMTLIILYVIYIYIYIYILIFFLIIANFL